jgi:hypothetical protein
MNQIKLKVNNFFKKAYVNEWDTYLLLVCLVAMLVLKINCIINLIIFKMDNFKNG